MRCSFCGTPIAKGTGILFIHKSGRTHSFCSRKCEKNMLVLGRKARTTQWTEQFREERRAQGKRA